MVSILDRFMVLRYNDNVLINPSTKNDRGNNKMPMTYREENEATKAKIASIAVSENMEYWSFSNLCRFRCINCGNFVSPATVRFYDYQVDRVLCYDCQENNQTMTAKKITNKPMEKRINQLEKNVEALGDSFEKLEKLSDSIEQMDQEIGKRIDNLIEVTQKICPHVYAEGKNNQQYCEICGYEPYVEGPDTVAFDDYLGEDNPNAMI